MIRLVQSVSSVGVLDRLDCWEDFMRGIGEGRVIILGSNGPITQMLRYISVCQNHQLNRLIRFR